MFKKEDQIIIPEGQSNYYKLNVEREDVSDAERFINNDQKIESNIDKNSEHESNAKSFTSNDVELRELANKSFR